VPRLQRDAQQEVPNTMSIYRVETAQFARMRSLAVALAAAGIVAPILFTALVVAQTLFRPGHSFVSLPSSALAAGPYGWVQDANFIVTGLLMSAYGLGLHLGVRQGRGGLIGPALLVLSGLGLAGAGLFPARDATGVFSQDQVGHFVAAAVAFLGGGTGLVVMSRRLASDPKWQYLAGYALASGIAMLLSFLAFGGLARTPGAPLHPWMGLVQWALVIVWFACTLVLALRLLRVARTVEAMG